MRNRLSIPYSNIQTCVIEKWTEILDEYGCVYVAYCDFMKVCHKLLVHKLKLYNIGKLYSR